MEADEFYQLAKKPDFPDEMVFQISAVNPDNPGTFSREGVSGVATQMETFLLARIFGHWAKSGKPPKEMKIQVKIEWKTSDEAELAIEQLPWFAGEIDARGMSIIDGRNRIPRDTLDS